MLFVLSDHGFCSFRRGINLNAWLRDNGYLLAKAALRAAATSKAWTGAARAPIRFGLGGLYLNLKGREAQGMVKPGRRGGSD